MVKIVCFLVGFSLVCSCMDKAVDNKIKVSDNILFDDNIKSQKKPDTIGGKLGFWDHKISVKKIKSQLDAVTTTFLTKSEILIFPDRIKNNFYGRYNLIKNNANGDPVRKIGKMVIYDSINPFKYDKDTDQFVEIILEEKGVDLMGGRLKLGMSYADIIKNFGESDVFERSTSTLIYRRKNKIALLKMKDSIVTKIRMGVYKEKLKISEIIY